MRIDPRSNSPRGYPARTCALPFALALALSLAGGAVGCIVPEENTSATTTGDTDPATSDPNESDSDVSTSEASTSDTSATDTDTSDTSDTATDTSASCDDDEPEPREPISAYTCASATFFRDPGVALAWRLSLTHDDGETWRVEAAVDGSHGPPPPWYDEPLEDLDELTELAEGPGLQFSFAGHTVAATTAVSDAPGVWHGEGELGDDEPLSIACWPTAMTLIDALSYRYDPSSGGCVDRCGDGGQNHLPLPMIRETALGHCADLTGAMLNEEFLGYPDLVGWDLAGATLDEASLSFANLIDVDLRGADLRGFFFGYAQVVGLGDDFTLPAEGYEVAADGTIDWFN